MNDVKQLLPDQEQLKVLSGIREKINQGRISQIVDAELQFLLSCIDYYQSRPSPLGSDAGKNYIPVEQAEHMLETLHMAYQFTLDEIQPANITKRLTLEQQKELGRRLAQYWNIKSLTSHQPEQEDGE